MIFTTFDASAPRVRLAGISVPRPLDDIFTRKVTGTRRDVIPSQVVQMCFKVTFERSVGSCLSLERNHYVTFLTAPHLNGRLRWQTQTLVYLPS